MRFANAGERAYVDLGYGWVDVGDASGGNLPSDVMALLERWDDLLGWADSIPSTTSTHQLERYDLPVPRPRQIFAIGLNYRAHAAESNLPVPTDIMVFTKFATSLTPHQSTVLLPNRGIDWEVELVIVVGRPAHHITQGSGWDYVAGLTIGQDLSWRDLQMQGSTPQFSLSKSLPGFGPLGPVLVTPDEFPDREDIGLACRLGEETLQSARTSDLVFGVSEIVERLSATVQLLPGDLIFTGTPHGVGMGRNPPRYLVPGTLESEIEHIGSLTVELVDGSPT